jgi:hypothetical protein
LHVPCEATPSTRRTSCGVIDDLGRRRTKRIQAGPDGPRPVCPSRSARGPQGTGATRVPLGSADLDPPLSCPVRDFSSPMSARMSTRAMTNTSTWDVSRDRRCSLLTVRARNSCRLDIDVDIAGASFGHDHHNDNPFSATVRSLRPPQPHQREILKKPSADPTRERTDPEIDHRPVALASDRLLLGVAEAGDARTGDRPPDRWLRHGGDWP